ncbi:basic membrane protein A [Virgibacillus natechei]|uniref:Basic membrane protein A n=1 Tax=Virgibacillus natechei TaxID=1216297 RepID=A0ABS4IAU0_9BACI|nr:BMP family protein [Virgibacillus natechei]MBP1968044.1 basic membrane protein A [Virgibacillus natechei]UZD14674.1 BMP family protein [Virgibacillus natechei]
MRKNQFILLFVLLLSLGVFLAACGNGADEETDTGSDNDESAEETTDYSAALVTDEGGVDDKSFNQSSWEGLQAWGEEHGHTEGEGYDYAQSDAASDYEPNLTRLVRNDYDLIFGIGFLLEDAIANIAEQNPETDFAIVDTVVDAPNVASITFAEHQGSFLAGVAAAEKTNTDQVGFVGGVESDLINKFETGFIAGVKSIDPDIEVDAQYVGDFSSADDGKLIATRMYNDGADIIYHSAGAAGNGVFSQAKDLKQNDPDRDVWVIGVDRDQHEEGVIGDENVTFTSMVKRVDISVQEVSDLGLNSEFPGGEVIEFGLEDEGVSIATTNDEALTDEIIVEVEDWEERIMNGDVDVPQTHEELETYLDSL